MSDTNRIRKKARYQELLDREQKFLGQQEAEELGQKRRQAVLDFLQVRTLMLHSALQLPLTTGSDDATRSKPPSDRSVSFDHAENCTNKADPDQASFVEAEREVTYDSINSKLGELLESRESFKFEAAPVSCCTRSSATGFVPIFRQYMNLNCSFSTLLYS